MIEVPGATIRQRAKRSVAQLRFRFAVRRVQQLRVLQMPKGNCPQSRIGFACHCRLKTQFRCSSAICALVRIAVLSSAASVAIALD